MMQYIVKFGESARVYYARHHAEQMCRALRLNGTPCTLTESDAEVAALPKVGDGARCAMCVAVVERDAVRAHMEAEHAAVFFVREGRDGEYSDAEIRDKWFS